LDPRIALAQLCALTGRFDEAWREVRRGRDGDRERALALLDAARGPFDSIGMPRWLRRAEELRQQLAR
jgi:hypothetical protein